MQARPIPQNPNRPPRDAAQPLRFHWVRTILLGILLLIVISQLRVRPPVSVQPLRPAPPIIAAARPQPTIAPVIQPSMLTEAQARELILHFNDAFRRGRLGLDASALEEVATGSALAGEQQQIAQLRAGGVSQQWDLLDLQITGLAPSANSMIICTSERWKRLDESAPPAPAVYTERYHLTRQGGVWFVDELSYSGCSP